MRQQDIDAVEIRRLADDRAESWQTTEKPVMQEAEYHCGDTRALAKFGFSFLFTKLEIRHIIMMKVEILSSSRFTMCGKETLFMQIRFAVCGKETSLMQIRFTMCGKETL